MSDRHDHRMYLNDVARRAEERLAAKLAAESTQTPDTPADTLRAAARHVDGHTLPATDLSITLARLFTAAAEDFDMVERINSRDPHNDGKTRVMPHHLAEAALAVARAVLEAGQ